MKTTSILNDYPKEQFLVTPVKEPEFHTIDSEKSIEFKGPTLSWNNMVHEEGIGNTNGDFEDKKEKLVTFEFPIRDTAGATQMKNIPPSALPNFRGTSSEGLNAFLFKFDMLCQSYDYSSNAQKLKLFPATLKDAAFRWFMGLGSKSIATWDEMKKVFLIMYQKNSKTRDIKENNFGMNQKEGECLEYLV